MKNDGNTRIESHAVVLHQDWLAARKAFLAKEKEFTRQRDELCRLRRDLPWEKVEKAYVFDGPNGPETLADLFGNKSQLIVYHFMFSPEWDEGCEHCSFWADNFNGIPVHLRQRDASFVAISRAPLAKLQAFERRMGWSFKWVSSFHTDFNYDFQASFKPEDVQNGTAFYNFGTIDPGMEDREGSSVFYKDAGGTIYHTYSTYARGIDLLNTAYNFLDLAPKGRGEDEEEYPQMWVRLHDQYPD
jgi:predicted dithiol-disulfide oxidoreductase (DUF899 family)